MQNSYYGKLFIIFVLWLCIANHVHATNAIKITDGYIKASIPGSDITAAYMTINNSSDQAITLQKVTSSISDRIEIHEHSMADGMMRMRQVDNIIVKANNNIVLQPSGLHLMIFALKQKLTEGDEIQLTLTFSNKTKINIQLPVRLYK
jgi:copper(I)-binding protein